MIGPEIRRSAGARIRVHGPGNAATASPGDPGRAVRKALLYPLSYGCKLLRMLDFRFRLEAVYDDPTHFAPHLSRVRAVITTGRRPSMNDHHTRLREAIARERARRPKSCPLRIASNGQWSKNVGGKRRTFGSVLDVSRAEAEARLYAYLADVSVGRDPRPIDAGRTTVEDVVSRFVADLEARVRAGEVESKTLASRTRYVRDAGRAIGLDRKVAALRPRDFAAARRRLVALREPVSVNLAVSAMRSAFRWAHEVDDLIDALPAYGDSWKPLPRAALRRGRRGKGFPGGRRHFHPEEVRALLEAASPLMRAAILLGVSAGMLAADLAVLRADQVDLERGWIDDLRPKTGVPRRAPVWPETREAILAWRADHERRGDVRAKGAERLLLVTRTGRPVSRESAAIDRETGLVLEEKTSAIIQSFRRLLVSSGVRAASSDAPGIGFATLRRTCATYADAAGDRLAKARIMAHVVEDVDDSYVDHVSDDRIRAVSDVIRGRLFGSHVVGSSSFVGAREGGPESPATGVPVAGGEEEKKSQ